MNTVRKRRIADAIKDHNTLEKKILYPIVEALEAKLKKQVRQIHDEGCSDEPTISINTACEQWPDVDRITIYCDSCEMEEIGYWE